MYYILITQSIILILINFTVAVYNIKHRHVLDDYISELFFSNHPVLLKHLSGSKILAI